MRPLEANHLSTLRGLLSIINNQSYPFNDDNAYKETYTKIIMDIPKDYHVKKPSHALLVDAIRTLPQKPEGIELTLLADGLEIPYVDLSNKEEVEEYIQRCRYQKIVPFSKKEISYSYSCEESIPKNNSAAKEFFGGGRTQEIRLRISSGFDGENIQRFNEIIFPSLLENNYKIYEGKIGVSGHKTGSHQTEGYESHLGIKINWGEPRGLVLILDNEYVDKETKEVFEKWFADLRSKYSIH